MGKMEHLTRVLLTEYKKPFLCGLISGFLSYMYMMTNKLPNWDEFQEMFSKGTTNSSGRWLLDKISLVYPDFSMPWLWGFLSIVLVTISACLTLSIFAIRNSMLQYLTVALMVSFPALVSTFAYMFTTTADMTGLLLTVLSVYLAVKGKGRYVKNVVPLILLVLSMGIYQAYLPIAVSYFLLFSLNTLVFDDTTNTSTIVKEGFRFVAIIAISGIGYLAITKAILVVYGGGLNSSASEALDWLGMFGNLVKPYKFFFLAFFERWASLITTGFSQKLHIIGAFITIILFLQSLLRKKDRVLLGVILLLLFPASVNCLFVFITENMLGTMESFGFFSIYIFAIILLERAKTRPVLPILKIVLPIFLGFTVICNVYTANRCWLQLQIAYDNMKAVYTPIIAQINMTPGFDQESKIVFLGEFPDNPALKPFEDEKQLEGIPYTLLNVYSREAFLRKIMNYNVNYAKEEELLSKVDRSIIDQMPCWPYYGSIIEADGYIVVKAGPTN